MNGPVFPSAKEYSLQITMHKKGDKTVSSNKGFLVFCGCD